MSYLVLARKYRPRNFSEMVGQAHVVQALTNALTQGRLHHAWLFTGTRGVGKTTVSRILAKSLNCQGEDGRGSITATPCGVCAACSAIDAGRFVDYTELDAASHRGVDEVQGLLEQAVYKPVQGRFKVFMIDEVHMLTTTAFNAMLKTLEEPPDYLKFVLATTDPQKVPVTVLSRCLQFNLRPMPPQTVFGHLQAVLTREAVEFDAQALRLLARAARGSMRDALSLADQAIAFGSGRLQESAVRQMLGSVDSSHVFALIGALAQAQGSVVVQAVEDLRRQGVSAASTLEEMCAVLHRMAVCQAAPEAAGDETDPHAADIARLAARMPRDETQLLYSICLHALGELGLAPDEYAALTMALLRLLAFKPPADAPPAAPAPAIEAIAGGAAEKKNPAPEPPVPEAIPAPIPAPAAVPTPIPAPPAAAQAPEKPRATPPAPHAENTASGADASLDDFWHATVEHLAQTQALDKLALQLARNAQLVARAADGWTLRCNKATLNTAATRARLLQVLAGAGHAQQLHIEAGTPLDTPAQRNAAASRERQRIAEDIITRHPLVQTLMREHGARILPGSVELLADAP